MTEVESKVVLVAGKVKIPDRIGHHDYLAGCSLLALLLEQTPGVQTSTVREGWPENENTFADARAVVFYTGGGRKHAFAGSPQRLARIQELVDRGVGLVMIHQAVRYPPELAEVATAWVGGVHVLGKAGRGHWPTHHREFPEHPVTRGVQPWKITDGWMNQIRFTEEMRGVTPLVWASKTYGGSSEGGAPDVVSWAYDRPAGGRSFCFTGLDAHSAWAVAGVRQLIVNGILWSAGLTIPQAGAPCALEAAALQKCLTPRGSTAALILEGARRFVRGVARG